MMSLIINCLRYVVDEFIFLIGRGVFRIFKTIWYFFLTMMIIAIGTQLLGWIFNLHWLYDEKSINALSRVYHDIIHNHDLLFPLYVFLTIRFSFQFIIDLVRELR